MKANFTPSQKDYKNITPFKLFVIEQFPFIEANFDAITEWQLLQKIGEKLNEIIFNTTNVTDNTINLYNSYVALENYVNDYFDNLDVQDEINNKLNEMAQDGTLQEIITSYIETNALLIFNNVNEMKQANNLINGSKCKTLGYYSVNDGGCATYLIRNITNNDNVDNGTLIPLNNENLVAELIIENNTINIKQLGARPQDKQNNKYDITQYLQVYMNFLDKITNRVRLYIPSGVWYCSGYTFLRHNGFDVFGDFGFCIDRVDGTIITSLNDNQDYIIQIGSTTNYTKNFSFKNILISTADFTYSSTANCFIYSTVKTVTEQALNLIHATFGKLDLFFCNIKGKAFKMSSCWELYFDKINFRVISNLDDCIWEFADRVTNLNTNANITACEFTNVMFEAIHGDLIKFSDKCNVANCHFGNINFEDYKLTSLGNGTYTTFTDENISSFDENNSIHKSIFKCEGNVSFDVDTIAINNFSSWYYESNSKKYVSDTIINCLKDYLYLTINIDKISISGLNKNARVIKTTPDLRVYNKSDLNINSISIYADKILYLDINKQVNFLRNISNLKSYTNANVMPNNFTPFYKIVNSENMVGTIQYDKDSINDLNLTYTMTKYNFPCHVIYSGGDIIVRAKIPLNEIAKIAIQKDDSSSAKHVDLTGTGDYKYYTITGLSSFLEIGDFFHFSFVPSSEASSCYLDVLSFK